MKLFKVIGELDDTCEAIISWRKPIKLGGKVWFCFYLTIPIGKVDNYYNYHFKRHMINGTCFFQLDFYNWGITKEVFITDGTVKDE